MIAVLLFLSLFLLFWILFDNEALGATKINSAKEWLRHYAAPILSAIGAFFLSTLLCRTPLAGIAWACLGWLAPGWVSIAVSESRKSRLRSDAKSIIASASGLYAARMVTPEVVKTVAMSIPDPLAREFQTMIGRRQTDKRASFPSMFEGLAVTYDLPEFKAMASIIEASENAGGPKAASDGLKQLSASLRNRDRRLTERRKETLQPMIAAFVTIILTVVGFLLDITVFSQYYASGAGRIVLSGASLLILVMAVIVAKTLSPKDLTGGGVD